MTTFRWHAFPESSATAAALLCAAIPASVCAAAFVSADETARRTFPSATAFKDVLVTPTAQDAAALAPPGAPPRGGPMRVIEARQGNTLLGRVVVDSVVGKFEQIDYAVALGTDGRVLGVEVLTYRESHGAEVRLPAWRNQFVGKTAADPLKIGVDIANLSGATLSCTHLTDGVHRVVAWAAKLPKAPSP